MRAHRVRALLMGGQACVFYGAAEFSRDTDFAILADVANLARLRKALAVIQAEPIAVPQRPLLALGQSAQTADVEQGLAGEESAERQRDKEHWIPLRRELEQMRHSK